jgi:hypothetical protein
MKVLLLALGAALALPSMSARDYYNELRSAGALNHYVDEYACFSDEEHGTFVVMSKGKAMLQRMRELGNEDGAKAMSEGKNLLFVQSYNHGVANDLLMYDPDDPTGSNFSVTFEKPFHGKMAYSINWTTGRYKLQLSYLDLKLPAIIGYGKCELIHPENSASNDR